MERSFLSVREWVQTIRDTTDCDDLPIMICANKMDLRDEKAALGVKVVTTEMGSKLAEECNAMFCETSAKTGSQLMTACQEITR